MDGINERAEPARESVADRVRRIVAESLCVLEAQVTDDASFRDGLGADSLDEIQLVLTIEEAFSIEIPAEDAEKLLIVGHLVAYVERAVVERADR